MTTLLHPTTTWRRLPFALVLLASLSGCTSLRQYVQNGFKVGPNYCPPRADVADQWIDDANPHVSTEPADDAAWWRTFDDPVLDALIETAYRQNLTLRIAGERILEVRAQRDIAVGNIFPQTQQAFGDYERTNLSRNAPTGPSTRHYDKWELGANLSWELDFWGRFRRAVESADARLDASIENYDDVLVLLLAEVAQRYAELRTAEQRLEYARKNVADQKQSLNLARVKFQNGATTKLDVTQGESNLAQTQAYIPPLEAARRQASNRLCILLGMPPRQMDDVLGRGAIPSAPPRVAVGIPADLLRRRPDVRRAEREAAAQSEQIGIAAAELYPHFTIDGTIYYDAANFRDLFDAGSFAGNVGPSFRWNLLNYGRLTNNIRVQESRFRQLALIYQETVLRANAEVEDALVAFLNAHEQVKHLSASVEAARQSLDLVRIQYNEGKTDFNRVLNVEQLLTQQEDQLAQSRGSVATNLILVYKSIGGGWQIRLNEPPSPPKAPKAERIETPTEEPMPLPPEPPGEKVPEPPEMPK